MFSDHQYRDLIFLNITHNLVRPGCAIVQRLGNNEPTALLQSSLTGLFCILQHCVVLSVELREGALSGSTLAGGPDHTQTHSRTHTHTPLCDSRQSAWHCPPSDRGRPECQRAAMAATATDPSVSAEGDSITVTTGYIIHLRRALAGSVHEMGKIHECSIIFHSVNAFNSI